MNTNSPQYFQPGEQVVSIAYHPPEIKNGTRATISSPKYGNMFAVKLPDGELHTWFAQSELQPIYNTDRLNVGDYARIVYSNGHPPKIHIGMIVQIAKIVPDVIFYDLILENGNYHRWLADFELAEPL